MILLPLIVIALAFLAGVALLVWWARGWWCRLKNPKCPERAPAVAAAWHPRDEARAWRAAHPNGLSGERHHLQRITTQIATPKDLLDSLPEAGAPLPIEPTPTTGVANPRRKVP